MMPYLPYVLWSQLPFGDPDSFLDWNGGPHWLIHQQLAKATGTALVELDSLRQDPFPHGILHRDLSAVLGLGASYDFTNYDLNDPESWAEFHLAHAAAHQSLAAAAKL